MGLAYLREKRVAEVTRWDFRKGRLVEDFKVVFRVKNFNNPFLFLS